MLFFIETQSGIFNVNNYGFGIARTLLCFILVPTAFALPIIIKKLKLLFIPSVIMPLVIVVYYLGEYSYMVLFFCIALAFIGAFGAVAGFLIRSFRSGRSKAKIVKITVGILVLLTPVLFMSYVFAGFPLHSMPVNKIVREYVADTYSEFDITVSRTRYDWYDGKYVTTIHDRNDKDIYFEVWCITKTPLLNPSNIIEGCIIID